MLSEGPELAPERHGVSRSKRRATERSASAGRTSPRVFVDAFAVFDQEATHVMIAAFEQAWDYVRASGHVCAGAGHSAETRHRLAGRIVMLAADGELDQARLRTRALAALFPFGLGNENKRRP